MLNSTLTRLAQRPALAALISAVAWTAWAPAASAEKPTAAETAVVTDEVEVTEKARQLFEAGVDFIQDPDGARYGEAYRSFRAAYAESPSWKILGNLGIAAMKIERDGEAIEALETYLEKGRDEFEADEIQQVERDLRTLRASVTWVELQVNVPGAEVRDVRRPLSGQPVINFYRIDGQVLRLGIHNGSHTFTVSKKGYEPETWTLVASGEEKSNQFTLKEEKEETAGGAPPPQEPPSGKQIRPVPTLTWVTLGTTAAFAAGAAVTGTLALNKNAKYEDQNDGSDPQTAKDLRDSGKMLNLTTDILIGAAVVSAGIATVSYFTRPRVTVEEDTALKFTPAAFPGGGALLLSGGF